MAVKMILAVDRGNAIGWKDGRLPWKIPADMKRFKELTSGHDVIMGYDTFKSLGRPNGLPNRVNYVMSSHFDQHVDEGFIIPSDNVRQAVTSDSGACNPGLFYQIHQMDQTIAADYHSAEPKDLWVIGGAQVYNQFLIADEYYKRMENRDVIDEIHVTLVDANSEADVKLPFDLINWKLFVLRQAQIGVQWNLEQISPPQKTDEGITFTFLTLKKIK